MKFRDERLDLNNLFKDQCKNKDIIDFDENCEKVKRVWNNHNIYVTNEYNKDYTALREKYITYHNGIIKILKDDCKGKDYHNHDKYNELCNFLQSFYDEALHLHRNHCDKHECLCDDASHYIPSMYKADIDKLHYHRNPLLVENNKNLFTKYYEFKSFWLNDILVNKQRYDYFLHQIKQDYNNFFNAIENCNKL